MTERDADEMHDLRMAYQGDERVAAELDARDAVELDIYGEPIFENEDEMENE